MEFISSEQFSKQPKEVQKVFIDWWEPSLFDLYCYKDDLKIRRVTETDLQDISNNYLYNPKSKFAIPVFIEGQLRKFIEDKTGAKIEINYHYNGEYDINLFNPITSEYNDDYNLENISIDLLQAYWKVAVQIASEEVNNG